MSAASPKRGKHGAATQEHCTRACFRGKGLPQKVGISFNRKIGCAVSRGNHMDAIVQ